MVFRLRNDVNVQGSFNTSGIFDVMDATGDRHALAVRATASSPSTMNTVAYFRGDRFVGIGTTTPTATLEVNGTAAKPGGGSWASISDARLKKSVQPLQGALSSLLNLRGVTFEFKDPAALHERPGTRIGVIAQDVEHVFADWVDQGPDGFKRITYRGFEALAFGALWDLRAELSSDLHATADHASAEIAALRQENSALRTAVDKLEARLARLECRSPALPTAPDDATGSKPTR